MEKAGRIGIGAGATILGFYLIAQFTQDILLVITGIVCISSGIYLIASEGK